MNCCGLLLRLLHIRRGGGEGPAGFWIIKLRGMCRQVLSENGGVCKPGAGDIVKLRGLCRSLGLEI